MNKPARFSQLFLLASSTLFASWTSMSLASAQVLDPITGVTATSTSGNAEGNPGFAVSNNSLVAGASNILGASDSLGDNGFNSADASDFGNFVTFFPAPGTANITFNLGAAYNVSDLLIWNFSQVGFTNAGINNVTILTSSNGILFTPVVGPNLDGSFTFIQAPEAQYDSPRPIAGNNPPYPVDGTATEPAQVLSLSLPNTQYVELVINSNYGFSGGLVGVNEVNFVGTVVPEPSTYALMLVGLALLGFWLRRKDARA